MSSWAEPLVFLALTFGPGTAFASFSSNLGWYEDALGSKEVTIWMRFASLAPFPLMFFIQKMVDRRVDLAIGCKAAYSLRLLASQTALVGLVVLWMLMPLRVRLWGIDVPCILPFGVPLAACISANYGATIKLAAATDPKYVVWTHLGNSGGTAIMVLFQKVIGSGPGLGHGLLQQTLLLPLSMCCLNLLMILCCFQVGLFSKAMAQIETNHWPAPAVLDECILNEDVPDEEKGCDVAKAPAGAGLDSDTLASLAQPLTVSCADVATAPASLARRPSTTASGADAAEVPATLVRGPSTIASGAEAEAVPTTTTASPTSEAEASRLAQGPLTTASERAEANTTGLCQNDEQVADKRSADARLSMQLWIKVWLVAAGTGQSLDWILLTLIAFFGDAGTTQSLAGLTFLANAVGSISVLQLPRFRFFDRGPCHMTNALLCSARLVVCITLLTVPTMPKLLLKVLWVGYFAADMFQVSLTDLTATRFAPLALRSKVAHTNLMGTYGGMFLGLSAATAFSHIAHLGA